MNPHLHSALQQSARRAPIVIAAMLACATAPVLAKDGVTMPSTQMTLASAPPGEVSQSTADVGPRQSEARDTGNESGEGFSIPALALLGLIPLAILALPLLDLVRRRKQADRDTGPGDWRVASPASLGKVSKGAPPLVGPHLSKGKFERVAPEPPHAASPSWFRPSAALRKCSLDRASD